MFLAAKKPILGPKITLIDPLLHLLLFYYGNAVDNSNVDSKLSKYKVLLLNMIHLFDSKPRTSNDLANFNLILWLIAHHLLKYSV